MKKLLVKLQQKYKELTLKEKLHSLVKEGFSLDKLHLDSKFEPFIFLLLTPLYLGVTYYKTIMNPDQFTIMIGAGMMLFLFLPFQLSLKDNQSYDVKEMLENEQILDYFRTVYFFIAFATIVILVFYYFLNVGLFFTLLLLYIPWVNLSDKFINIIFELNFTSILKIFGMLMVFITSYFMSNIMDIGQLKSVEYHNYLDDDPINKLASSFVYVVSSVGNIFEYIFDVIKTLFITVFGLVLLFPTFFMAVDISRISAVGKALPYIALFFIVFIFPSASDFFADILVQKNLETTLRNISIALFLITFLGVLFQIRVFFTFFTKTPQTLTYISVGTFYLLMFYPYLYTTITGYYTIYNLSAIEEQELNTREKFRYDQWRYKEYGLNHITKQREIERRNQNLELKKKIDSVEDFKGLKRIIKD